ncbi:MAG TPA: DUF2179 domain-containing protein [bacterium]|nr:DUF2179 domain-containing protein [bacterium]
MLVSNLLSALLIFCLRVSDVTLGTVRSILVMRGVRKVAPFIGFLEVTIWVFAIMKVMSQLDNLWNILGYSSGYAVGILMGMFVEEKLGLGYVNVQIISLDNTPGLMNTIREAGFGITLMAANGHSTEVGILRITTPRKRLKELLALANRLDPKSFITVEDARHVIRGYKK